MVSLKKYVPCKCGANNSFDFNSDMNIDDLTLTARCPACGASVCISISALLSNSPSTPEMPPVQTALNEMETKANVEQAVRDLFKY